MWPFVSTNSIVQGEQVAQLWPPLFDRFKTELDFAHRTFAWGSEARGKAQVHVVVVGFSRHNSSKKEKHLFAYQTVKSEPPETKHVALSPYLVDASGLANPNLVVSRETAPLNGLPVTRVGSKPVDGGHYIFDDDQRAEFLAKEPGAAPYIRPFIGSREYLNGISRWIVHPESIPPQELRKLPEVLDLVTSVRTYRSTSEGSLAKSLADTPQAYHVTVIPEEPFLVLAEVSSERRVYASIGWMQPPAIPSNKILVVRGAAPWLLAILRSAMHMGWLRHISGRMKSDYSSSAGLVYNTFPMPPPGELTKLELHAQAILDARANCPDASLADHYDPNIMPADLHRAHQENDKAVAVDRLYRKAVFKSDRERVEHLFQLYEKMTDPLLAKPAKKRRKGAS